MKNGTEKHYVYNVFDYGVQGNAKDGFTVDDVFLFATDVDLPESVVLDDKKLIKALKQIGIIDKGIQATSINIEGIPDLTIYFIDTRKVLGGFCPAFELRCTAVYVKTRCRGRYCRPWQRGQYFLPIRSSSLDKR
jgi:hypothetical protein